MRTPRSRITALLSVSALALSLAACGSDSEADAADLAGEGTGDTCVIDTAVPVGAALSTTGAAASYGESQKKGLELAAKDLNAKDGVEYDLTVEDDQTDPRQGITVFEGFADDGQSVIIGPTLSNGAFQAQPIAQEEGVPVIAISNTASGIVEQGDYIHRVSLPEAKVIPNTVEQAVAKYGLENVVVMYSNDDAFTESGYAVFEESLKAQNINVSKTLTFSKADTDFRALLTEAKSENPDAIIVSALIEAAIPLVTQARELGIEVPIIGGNGFNNPKLMSEAGEAAEGVVVGAAWNSASPTPENEAFLAAYEEAYDAAPDQFAAQAYSSMLVLDAAVRSSCDGSRDGIKEGLATVSDLPTPLGSVTLVERDAEHAPVVQVVDGGAFTLLG